LLKSETPVGEGWGGGRERGRVFVGGRVGSVRLLGPKNVALVGRNLLIGHIAAAPEAVKNS
jgi:hypothetical protein